MANEYPDEVVVAHAHSVPRGAGRPINLIVVETAAGPKAYLNSCPHMGASLDLVRGRFTDVSGRFLMCAVHGALFDPENGRCVAGPCAGKGLLPIEVVMNGGRLELVDDPDSIPDSAL